MSQHVGDMVSIARLGHPAVLLLGQHQQSGITAD